MRPEKIRIAHILPWGLVGGVEHSVLKITRVTNPDRFEHVIFCRTDAPAVQAFFSSAGLEVHTWDAVEPSYHRPWPYLRASRALAKKIRQTGAHVVDCQEYLAAHYAALAGRLAGLPVINSVRNRFEVITRRNQTFLWPVNFFTFVSDATRKSFGYRIPPERTAVVYVGLDAPPYDPEERVRDKRDIHLEFGIPASAPLVGIVARVAGQKDHQTFIKAAARIAAGMPEARFLIVGEHSASPEMKGYYEELVQLIDANALASKVAFTGYRQDTLRVLRALDVFAHSTHLEGLPVVILEAMSQARPIVATAVDGIPEAIIEGQTGLLHAHQDDAEFARKIQMLLDDPALAARLGSQARQYCLDHFNTAQFARAVTDVYYRVLGIREPR